MTFQMVSQQTKNDHRHKTNKAYIRDILVQGYLHDEVFVLSPLSLPDSTREALFMHQRAWLRFCQGWSAASSTNNSSTPVAGTLSVSPSGLAQQATATTMVAKT